jgi:hypothetical protein
MGRGPVSRFALQAYRAGFNSPVAPLGGGIICHPTTLVSLAWSKALPCQGRERGFKSRTSGARGDW